MKNVLWFLFGMAGGFVVAHFVNRNPRGHELLAEVDARITEFTDRIGDAYREQEARITGLVDDAKDAAQRASETALDAAQRASDTAQDAAARAASAVADTASAAADAAAKLAD